MKRRNSGRGKSRGKTTPNVTSAQIAERQAIIKAKLDARRSKVNP